ncbi:N(6)-adenine-specific methyltransferase METTL4, partial [Callorhinchus milii]|uniref:N(6)-adenine-specific methyltransferase METTL4 n=1 Tax=Callorhinchus milii TaxID=7868 RepID=UPI001C3F6769
MAVLRQEEAGWLLDHLSHINNSYRCCHGPGGSGPSAGGYVFRPEYFSLLRPHILAGGGGEAAGEAGAEGEASARRRRKRRCRELNTGEAEAREYHAGVRLAIESGARRLLAGESEARGPGLGLDLTAGPGSTAGLGRTASLGLASKPSPAPPGDPRLAELCLMAARLPRGPGGGPQALGETPAEELDLFGRVTENRSGCARVARLLGQPYLLPPASRFLLSDLSRLEPLLLLLTTTTAAAAAAPEASGGRYGLITLDPPWENRSVRRSGRYPSLAPADIKRLPVPALAAPGCLVATWVTNRQRHRRFVREELYPHWGLRAAAEWHWVKVTRAGDFVFPLDSPHKKPYETLVLGTYGPGPGLTPAPGSLPGLIPDHRLLVSVPCSLHSHKPPLGPVLELAGLVAPGAPKLELFARSLQPGWTSWGNEVLKFQHLDYFLKAGTGQGCCPQAGTSPSPSPAH